MIFQAQPLYVGSQSSQQQIVALPLTATAPLAQVFPWLATSGSAPWTLADEVALFADELQEWAELTLPTALEGWPDDW